MKLIVGLGNPGKKYEKTRHNLGFMVLDKLARRWNVDWQLDKKLATLKALKKEKGVEIILAKPLTYMNNSGMAVGKILRYYDTKILSDLWVIHDDLDIPAGRIKITKGKGTAGHHGVISIVEALRTTDFVRFRLGIGQSKADNKMETLIDNPEKFVLEPFLPQESDEVRKMIKQTVLAIKVAVKDGIGKAMTQFNR